MTTLVAATSFIAGAAATITHTPATSLAVGQRHIFFIKVSGQTVTSVTDNGGNTYTQIGSLNEVTWNFRSYAYDAPITTAATTITVNFSGVPTAALGLFLYRCTGASATAAQVVGTNIPAASVTTTTDAIATGTLTPAAQPGTLIGQGVVAGATVTAGTGFTDLGSGGFNDRVENKAITALTAVAVTFTSSAAGGGSNVFAVYLQDAAIVPQSNPVMYIG